VTLDGKDKDGNVRAVHAEPSEYQEALQSAGVSQTQGKRWQKLAAVDPIQFEDAPPGRELSAIWPCRERVCRAKKTAAQGGRRNRRSGA